MIASLPMYDWPELRPATDALWSALSENLQRRGIAAPDQLDRETRNEALWLDPNLVLSQTCGFPYRRYLQGKTKLVATPHYDVDGCSGADYQSLILVRKDCPATSLRDLDAGIIALNNFDSQSGYNALVRTWTRDRGEPLRTETLRVSGSHRQSLQLVANGEVMVCAVDPVCFAHSSRFDADAVREVRVLTRSDPTPTLPMITSLETDDQALKNMRAALDDLIADPALADIRETLFLAGFEPLTDDDYQRIDMSDPILADTA